MTKVTRLVIDAPTLVQLVDQDAVPDPQHRLVAPNAIRSDALQLLLDDALVSVDERLLARAAGLVPIAPLAVLLAPRAEPTAP